MSQEIVRCPYCVEGSDFRPMLQRAEDSFICLGCGHESASDSSHGRCACEKCAQVNRAADRISRDRVELPPAANS